MSCLERQVFDEHAFGVPFYRVSSEDWDALAEEIARLKATGRPFIIDAKRDARDLEARLCLDHMGFREVCMQVRLTHHLACGGAMDPDVALQDLVNWPDHVIDAHVANFTFDRFSLDPSLPREGHDRLYQGWIRNTLASDRAKVFHIGHNFLTFRPGDRSAKIDLVSVLDRRQGIGRRLLASLLAWAKTERLEEIRVVTQLENKAAVALYVTENFEPCGQQVVYHFDTLSQDCRTERPKRAESDSRFQ